MVYRNTKTGDVINVASPITGGYWEPVELPKPENAEPILPEEPAKQPDTEDKTPEADKNTSDEKKQPKTAKKKTGAKK